MAAVPLMAIAGMTHFQELAHGIMKALVDAGASRHAIATTAVALCRVAGGFDGGAVEESPPPSLVVEQVLVSGPAATALPTILEGVECDGVAVEPILGEVQAVLSESQGSAGVPLQTIVELKEDFCVALVANCDDVQQLDPCVAVIEHVFPPRLQCVSASVRLRGLLNPSSLCSQVVLARACRVCCGACGKCLGDF